MKTRNRLLFAIAVAITLPLVSLWSQVSAKHRQEGRGLQAIFMPVLYSFFTDGAGHHAKDIKIYYVDLDEPDFFQRVLVEKYKVNVSLKNGNNYRIADLRFIDNDSGARCGILKCKILTLDKNQATVAFQWSLSQTAGAGVIYTLKQAGGVWNIVNMKHGYSV